MPRTSPAGFWPASPTRRPRSAPVQVRQRKVRWERFPKPRPLARVRLSRNVLGGAGNFEVGVGGCLAGLVGLGDGSRGSFVRVFGVLVRRSARPTDRDLPGLQIDALAARGVPDLLSGGLEPALLLVHVTLARIEERVQAPLRHAFRLRPADGLGYGLTSPMASSRISYQQRRSAAPADRRLEVPA